MKPAHLVATLLAAVLLMAAVSRMEGNNLILTGTCAVTGTGDSLTSSAASGNFAVKVLTEGAKVGFGPDTECHEVGTSITCTALAAPTFTATSQVSLTGGASLIQAGNGQGVGFGCGNSSGDQCHIRNNIAAATATATIPAFYFNQANGALGANDMLLGMYDNSVLKWSVDAEGDVAVVGNMTGNTRSVPVAAPFDGGTNPVYIEYGNCTLSSSACTITFKNAFSVGPRCVCSHINATPIACGPAAAASTTGVTFNVTAGSGQVDWHCIGER